MDNPHHLHSVRSGCLPRARSARSVTQTKELIKSDRVFFQRPFHVAVCAWFAALLGCSAALELEDLENGFCEEGTKACNDDCVNTDSPSFGCAGPSCTPCALDHALSNCDPRGACSISGCLGDYRDCDGNPENGCEVDVAHDPNNCGQCGTVCSTESGVPACGDSRCTLSHCFDDFANCDEDFSNGCETDLRIAPEHCGECDNPCSGTATCVAGECID